MYFAIGVEPTKEMARTFGCVSSASTHSRPPWTRLSTPFGRPAFSSSSTEADRGERDFFARLEDEGISAGEREREHPQRHHRGEIERRDPDAHAERLEHRLAIDAAREVLERVAQEQRGHAAGVFDIFEAAVRAAARFGERLAVLARDDRADAVEVFLDELPVAEKHPRALDGRRLAPGGKRRVRGFDGGVHPSAPPAGPRR